MRELDGLGIFRFLRDYRDGVYDDFTPLPGNILDEYDSETEWEKLVEEEKYRKWRGGDNK